MRLAGIFDNALGGILSGGEGMFGLAGQIGSNPTNNFGMIGNTLLNDGNYYGAVGEVSGIKNPAFEGLGMPGWDSFGY